MSKPPTALQVITRDHNFRKGRILAIPKWARALDDDLQDKVRTLCDEQLDREEYRYEARVMAIKSGDPGGLSHVDHELANALVRGRKAENV